MLFAHGVGSRGDLPLPLWMFTWAAAIALVISFVALGLLWTEPRLASAATGRAFGSNILSGDSRPWPTLGFVLVGKVAAMALLAASVWAGFFGLDDTGANLLPVTLYVIVWVGAQLVNGLFGDVWRAISPITTLAQLVERVTPIAMRREQPPAAVGLWPAAAGLGVFLFYELAHPSGSSPRSLAWMLLVHIVVSLVLAAIWGAEWIADNEPFAALLTMLSFMSVVTRSEDGRIVVRPPMSGLATMPIRAGTLACLLIVLGGTTFDGFSESEAGRSVLGRPTGWGGSITLTIWLVVSIAVVSALFAIGSWWTSRVTELDARQAAAAFTPSLVPIVFGYGIAHYAQLLVDETQTFLFTLSDPGGLGWNLFGGADGEIDFNLISVDLIAWVQVLAILFGHIGAVIVAHDRSIELFPPGESLRSQFAMLLVMVLYSTLGLWLLLNA